MRTTTLLYSAILFVIVLSSPLMAYQTPIESGNKNTNIPFNVLTTHKTGKSPLGDDHLRHISIDLNTKTDLNQIYLTLLAIFTVLGTTVYSVKTLSIKTNESIAAHDKSIECQRELGDLNTKAQILSGNRQAWINTLRNEISEYLSTLHSLQSEVLSGTDCNRNKTAEAFRDAFLHRAKIELLINPEEDDHRELVTLVYSALPLASKTPEELNEIEAAIVRTSQTILKREWNRVKRVE